MKVVMFCNFKLKVVGLDLNIYWNVGEIGFFF